MENLTVICAVCKCMDRNWNVVWKWFEVMDSLVDSDCGTLFVVGGPVVGEMVNKIGFGVIVGVPLASVAMVPSPGTNGFS